MYRHSAKTLATLAAAFLALPATQALAQAEGPPADPDPNAQPPPPGPPPPPDLVLSGRNVRMTRSNVVGIRMGCRGTASQAGEACIGSVTVRLVTALTVPFDPPGRKPPTTRRIFPFDFAVRDFTLAVGDGLQLRMRLSPPAAKLVRDQERVRVDLIVSYNSRAGSAGTARRNVRVYFAKRPGI